MKTLLAAVALLFAATTAHAADTSAGKITIEAVWARATPGKAPNGAGYMTIYNAGNPDRLLSAASNVAKRTELHTHLMEDGVMKMRKVDAIDLPQGQTVEFKPHGLHIMFIGLNAPLVEGQTVELTLNFEKTGSVEVSMPVMPIGHMGGNAMGGHKMDGHGGKMEMKKQ